MEQSYKSVKLSSKWVKFGYYFIIVFLVFTIPAAIYMIYSLIEYFQLNILITLILLFALVGGCIYLLTTLTEGYIENDVFHFQKFRKPMKKYNLDQLKDVKVYENRKEKYILATVDNGTGPEKYLFTNSKLFYAGEEKNTETILREILKKNKEAQ